MYPMVWIRGLKIVSFDGVLNRSTTHLKIIFPKTQSLKLSELDLKLCMMSSDLKLIATVNKAVEWHPHPGPPNRQWRTFFAAWCFKSPWREPCMIDMSELQHIEIQIGLANYIYSSIKIASGWGGPYAPHILTMSTLWVPWKALNIISYLSCSKVYKMHCGLD